MTSKSAGVLSVIVLVAITAALGASTAFAAPKGAVAYAVAPSDGVYQTAVGMVTLQKGDKYPAYIFESRDPVRKALQRTQSKLPNYCVGPEGRSPRLQSLALRPQCGGVAICGSSVGPHGRYYLRDGFSSWNLRACHSTSSTIVGDIRPGETYSTDNAVWAEFVCVGGWGTAYWYRAGWAGWFNARGVCNYSWGSCSYATPPGFQYC
jgi:hypothetical protein